MIDSRSVAVPFTVIGLLGAITTALMGLFWAPLVTGAWHAPEAYRILYWHVPFAWASFLSFCLLFIGAFSWYGRRSERGWGMVVVISGPIWASAEWDVPWDWGDVRLNTYALLTAVALFLVMSIKSQPDGEGTRDSLSAVGLFGFILVPITAFATTLWQSSHPGVVVIESEETGLDPEIKLLLFFGVASFFFLFVGLALLNEAIRGLSEEIDEVHNSIYEEASN